MAARRLAVALPPNPRLLPPPPPAPTAPGGRRVSPSLASMLSGDFISQPRYRCCCRLLHVKTASFLIGIIDTLGMSAAFGRGVHLGVHMQHNPAAISWLVISSLMFAFGCACTVAMFVGVWREKYLWMIPKLVMKISAVVLYSATTIVLVYMMMEHSQYLLDLVAEHVTKSDYETVRLALRTGGGGLAVAFLLMALLHVWWFFVLYRCYKYLKDRYFWKQTRLVHSESNDNHVAAIVASLSAVASRPTATIRTGSETGVVTSDLSRSRHFSTSEDVNSAVIYSAGRNGSLRRSVSSGAYDHRNPRTALLASNSSNTLVSDFDSIHMQEYPVSNAGDEAVPCSCNSPNMPHSSPERQAMWTGYNQTHV